MCSNTCTLGCSIVLPEDFEDFMPLAFGKRGKGRKAGSCVKKCCKGKFCGDKVAIKGKTDYDELFEK